VEREPVAAAHEWTALAAIVLDEHSHRARRARLGQHTRKPLNHPLTIVRVTKGKHALLYVNDEQGCCQELLRRVFGQVQLLAFLFVELAHLFHTGLCLSIGHRFGRSRREEAIGIRVLLGGEVADFLADLH